MSKKSLSEHDICTKFITPAIEKSVSNNIQCLATTGRYNT